MNILKKILIILGWLLLCTLRSYAQKVDTIIVEKAYRSYYSYQVKAPLFVVYKLYKGGGDESRKGMTFKSKFPHFKYDNSGYDKGHLANAEDFSYDKSLLESTFRDYNTLPQTPKLNRSIWKVWETKIRKNSQSDSLLIICGGSNFINYIPHIFFKVVYSLTNKEIIYALKFTSDTEIQVIDPKSIGISFEKYRY